MNQNLKTIYFMLKRKFHGQLLVAGSQAMHEYGLCLNPNPLDLDLVLLHQNNDQEAINHDKKRLRDMSDLNESPTYNDSASGEKIGYRYFLTFNGKVEKYEVHVFVAKSLLVPETFTSNDIHFVSPANVIQAKKMFNRPKDLKALSEMAKLIMP
jgi:hypothetical protein